MDRRSGKEILKKIDVVYYTQNIKEKDAKYEINTREDIKLFIDLLTNPKSLDQ